MRIKRRSFTLIEGLLVLFLLGFVAFIVGIKIQGSRDSERFKGAVHTLVDRLRLSQELMMLGIDVTCNIEKEARCYKVQILPLQGDASFSLIEKASPLKGIDSIEFLSDEGVGLDLQFISKGCRMPKGTLIVKHKDDEKRIVLPGYPSFIRYDGQKRREEPKFRSEELYPL